MGVYACNTLYIMTKFLTSHVRKTTSQLTTGGNIVHQHFNCYFLFSIPAVYKDLTCECFRNVDVTNGRTKKAHETWSNITWGIDDLQQQVEQVLIQTGKDVEESHQNQMKCTNSQCSISSTNICR